MVSRSFIEGTLMFNQRVLSLGTPVNDEEYSLEEIKELLFYNQIYCSNMDKVFRESGYKYITQDYVNDIQTICDNLNKIINLLLTLGINIYNGNSFEQRLSIRKKLDCKLKQTTYTPEELRTGLNVCDGKLYYFSSTGNKIMVTEIEEESPIYNTLVTFRNKDEVMYWKTDDSIKRFLENTIGQTAVMKFTVSNNSKKITKIEYHGSMYVIDIIVKLYRDEILILHNPALYLKDIELIIENNIIEQSSDLDMIQKNNGPDNLDEIFNIGNLIIYPESAFDSYLKFLYLVSISKEVFSLGISLYRIGDNPALYYILKNALSNGIKIVLNIESEASEESINTFWINEFHQLGINIYQFGSTLSKVHCKVTLVLFKDGRTLTQIGTGNYHTQTTTSYTDISYITGNEEIGQSAINIFRMFTGAPNETIHFSDKFLVTKYNLRSGLINLIRTQSDLKTKGYILIKCNAFDDLELSNELQKAADNGCWINMIIRGACTWDAGERLNKNVIIRSFVWECLEHSRIFKFGKDDNSKIFIGSLDLITSKIENRIETIVQVVDSEVIKELEEYLEFYLSPKFSSWRMINDDGIITYIKEGIETNDIISS